MSLALNVNEDLPQTKRFRLIVALLLGVLFCFSTPAVADNPPTREAQSALRFLNKIRQDAGLRLFRWNSQLYRAAHNHAVYLTRNRVISHFESKGHSYFTGVRPGDRAVAQGYNTYKVTENFSSGQKNTIESIEGLMSAIYHRLAFLDPFVDEIGIGIIPFQKGYTFVYNMGNQKLNAACRIANSPRTQPHYKDMCRSARPISAAKVESITNQALQNSPPIIIWPVDRMDEVSPAFFEEIPDPLPNQSVSGYPVSVQFNTQKFPNAEVMSFRLFEVQSGNLNLVSPLHLMQTRNDPNKKLKNNHHVLFPLNRLKWGGNYKAELIVNIGNSKKALIWNFKTKVMKYPMFQIASRGELLHVVKDKTYAVYVKPNRRTPTIQNIQWEAPRSVQASVNWEDKNTILVTLTGQSCRSVRFAIDNGAGFQIQIAKNDNINSNHDYLGITEVACLKGENKNSRGFLIKGKGEILKFKSGVEYWVEIQSKTNATKEVQLRYPEGLKAELDSIANNILKIRIIGRSGQKAEVKLNSNKSFKVILE